MYGAGNEIRTRDLNLGKVALYQLSYSRVKGCALWGMALFVSTGSLARNDASGTTIHSPGKTGSAMRPLQTLGSGVQKLE